MTEYNFKKGSGLNCPRCNAPKPKEIKNMFKCNKCKYKFMQVKE